MGWETSISNVYGAFAWRTYVEGSLLKPLRGSATPEQGNRPSATPERGNRPSATTKALNHMGHTFQCVGNLDSASIEL